jgi:hypothetical protein
MDHDDVGCLCHDIGSAACGYSHIGLCEGASFTRSPAVVINAAFAFSSFVISAFL